MADEMFFSQDSLSLRRGRRVAKRTPTSRPCALWPSDARELEVQGRILDINPYGMLIRMDGTLPVGTVVHVQLLRDDASEKALSIPLEGRIVRHAQTGGVHTDHGIRVEQKEVRKSAAPVIRYSARPQGGARPRTRMHTIDVTVSDAGIRHSGR